MSDDLAAATRATRLASAGWYIQRLAAALDRAMDAELALHGLTVQRFALLMTVLEQDGITQSAIGARFSAPAYAISRALDALEADGFIRRSQDRRSRRTNRISATTKARNLAPILLAVVERVNGKLLEGLDARDTAQLMGFLRALHAEHRLADPG